MRRIPQWFPVKLNTRSLAWHFKCLLRQPHMITTYFPSISHYFHFLSWKQAGWTAFHPLAGTKIFRLLLRLLLTSRVPFQWFFSPYVPVKIPPLLQSHLQLMNLNEVCPHLHKWYSFPTIPFIFLKGVLPRDNLTIFSIWLKFC